MNSTDDKVNSSSSFVYNLADGQEHYVGVWNLKVAPKVFYQRISGIIPPWNCRKNVDGTYSMDNVKLNAPYHWTGHELVLNPD